MMKAGGTSNRESTRRAVFSPIRKLKGKTSKLRWQNQGAVVLKRHFSKVLVAYSNRQNAGVSIDKILCYPPAPVSIPLCTALHLKEDSEKQII